ncbi:MAG: hypothetical protein KDA89_05065 [Planctomycetaceae bacterium]|nr:hypothetical protein [Planctomycetaceae bacterium]
MQRLLIVGLDSVVGRSLANRARKSWKTTGLWFRHPVSMTDVDSARISESNLKNQLTDAAVTVFCGDAALSSWDSGFGAFPAEESWLGTCLRAIGDDQRMVFVSSDAVFSGPQVFHSDSDDATGCDPSAVLLRDLEHDVLQKPNALVVRTNVVAAGVGVPGWLDHVTTSLRNGDSPEPAADVYSTPIGDHRFAEILETCLQQKLTGTLNIGGAERATPFQLIRALSNVCGFDATLLKHSISRPKPAERSLRCQRLRTELNIFPPMLTDLAESLGDSIRSEPRRRPVAA